MSLAKLSIIDVIDSAAFWRPWFKSPASWAPWRVFLKTLFGLPLDRAELELFRQCTGRTTPSPGGYLESWLVIGRRGGKSFALALIAVFLAAFRDWSPYLTPGERGVVQIVATDRKQARVIFRYCRALLTEVPALASLVQRDDDEVIELKNSISIEIATASFRSIRGRTVIAALLDELAFWRVDETAANPDREIVDAIRPAMSTVPGAMLLGASSPYARRGVLYEAYREGFGKDDAEALVWQAPTLVMHPTLPKSVVDKAYERDAASAAAEFGAEFRSDIEAFIPREVVDAAVVPGRHELPPTRGIHYLAFVDPSGGSSDSMTLAIAHHDHVTKRAILDAVRERRPPFSPEAVVEEFAGLLKAYRVSRVHGDRYAGEWPRERFLVHGIQYQPAESSKSDIYRDVLPIINSGGCELLDLPRLAAQLCSLERRTARGGRDSIDHPPGSHDDLGNAAAGVLTLASGGRMPIAISASVLARARMPGARSIRGRHGGYPKAFI